MSRILRVLLLFSILITAPTLANAAVCSLDSSPGIIFNDYASNTFIRSQSTLYVTCDTANTTVTITADQLSYRVYIGGLPTVNNTTTPGLRLFKDSAYSLNLKNNGVVVTTGPANTPQAAIIYGEIKRPDGLPLGYTGAVTVTATPLIAATNDASANGLPVSGWVAGTCSIDTSSGLVFNGNTGGVVTSSSNILVTCYNGGSWELGIGGTTNTPAITVGTGTYKAYAYSDAAYTNQLPLITNCGGACISGTGTGSAQSNTVFFKLAGDTPTSPLNHAGSVSGTIPVSVSF